MHKNKEPPVKRGPRLVVKAKPVLFVVSITLCTRSEQHVQEHVLCMWVCFNHICIYPLRRLMSETTALSTAISV